MSQINLVKLVKAAIRTIRTVQVEIEETLGFNPQGMLNQQRAPETGKSFLEIDGYAELRGETLLRHMLDLKRHELEYLGEERLGKRKDAKDIDLTSEQRPVVLVDMVDGTDLLERGLSNWCTAMVFFDPQAKREEKIIAAFVGIPDDGVYYATRESRQARKYRFHVERGQKRDVPLLNALSQVNCIADASICFYGQQAGNLLWLADLGTHRFLDHLKNLKEQHNPLQTRIYNLAGMPMMMKMLESGDGLRRIDAVFDVCGQQPHDMVAGAYIAHTAGAVLSDLNGNQIELEQSLLRPAHDKLKYVLAATDPLAKDLRSALLNSKHSN
jgi:fructose-1,6-bisphosphatase/inositol monophosphatase family enzyme